MSISTRKIIYSDKTPLLVSCVAFCVSIVALLISVKSINKTNEIEIINDIEGVNKRKIEQNIPDVEIIRPDGSVVQVKSLDSKDNISQIVDNKNNQQNLKNTLKQPQKRPIPITRKEATKEKQGKNNINNSQISGNYVLQVGSFKTKELAVKHCEKVKKYIGTKQCSVSAKNNRSIVYPFSSIDEAKNMAMLLLQKAGINGLVKKNIK
jgi:cell division protein FtsN